MEKIKVVLDRENVSSEEIASRQDLSAVLKGASTKVPVWKSGWFYGTVGLASIAVVAITATWNQTAIDESAPERVLTASLSDSNVQPAIAVFKPEVDTDLNLVADLNEDVQEETVKAKEEIQKPVTVQKSEVIESTEINSLESKPTSETMIAPKPDHSLAKVNGVVNKMPSIGGVYYGPISIDKLCSNNQIKSSPDIEITSFKINYYDGASDVVKAVSGDIIPEEICNEIRSASMNSTVFITEIRGLSKHGESMMLSSMSLIPTK